MTERKIQICLKRSVVVAALSVTVLPSQRPDFLLASQDIPLYPVPMASGVPDAIHPQAPSVGDSPGLDQWCIPKPLAIAIDGT